MAEPEKLSDFFAKLDRSKKRDGFNTLNEVAQRTQRKLEANIQRQQKKDVKVDQVDDDEWKPIEVDTVGDVLLPWDFEVCENIVGSLDQLKVSQQADVPKLEQVKPEEKWREPAVKVEAKIVPKVEAKIEEKIETKEEHKPLSNGKFKFGPGVVRQKIQQQRPIQDSDFPDLVETFSGKKTKKKNQKKGITTNGSQSIKQT